MKRFLVFACTLLVAVALDQGSKNWIAATLDVGQRLTVVSDFVFLTHVRNPGAAFGLFANVSAELRLAGFLGVLALASVLVAFMLYALKAGAPGELRSAWALGLVEAGALGNALDRVMRDGAVLDFIQLRPWAAPRWPDFNLADVFIVVGVASLLIDLLASEEKSEMRAQ